MSIRGIHHLTAVCSNAQRTVDFYTDTLGMHLVKQTVNFDDTSSYHLYFGDSSGSPGTLITFFEWRNLPQGSWGIGTTHHLAFSVGSVESQLRWKRWLQDRGIAVTGPYDRRYFRSIYFTDPDGLLLEIATAGPGWTVDESEDRLGQELIMPPEELRKGRRDERLIAAMTWPEPVGTLTGEMRLQGLHHITGMSSDIEHTTRFCTDVLGMRLLKRTLNFDDPTAPHYYFGVGEGRPGTVITYFGYAHTRMRRGSIGTGMTHHFAFVVDDDHAQEEWRVRLLSKEVPVTPVMDRKYFRSIYFSDPDGHILEIATAGPGFMIDEPADSLGSVLSLPEWLEHERSDIAASLSPLSLHENN